MHGYVMVATGNRMEDKLLHYVMCVSLMSIMQACTESISLANVFILLTLMIMYGYAMFATGKHRGRSTIALYYVCLFDVNMQACTNLFHLPMHLYY